MNCPNCYGNGCEDCNGSGDVVGCVVCEDALPADDSDRCARCSDMSACENPPTTDLADAIPFDGEPFDIDGDDGFDVYAGGPESPYDDGDAGDWYGDD